MHLRSIFFMAATLQAVDRLTLGKFASTRKHRLQQPCALSLPLEMDQTELVATGPEKEGRERAGSYARCITALSGSGFYAPKRALFLGVDTALFAVESSQWPGVLSRLHAHFAWHKKNCWTNNLAVHGVKTSRSALFRRGCRARKKS
ncbi:hypothetical protein BX667DRAFT_379575 [Coemansia mojavensis]|nr:hypothetical protein BX667DRAFT_379575 [Coemansia mojavensis]